MVSRRGFVGAVSAFVVAVPRAAAAVETPAGGAGRDSADGRLTLDAVDVLIATLPRVRLVWKPPAALPPLEPIAYYAGLGGDEAHADEPAIWLSAEHPELVSPRRSRLIDEIPLSTELLLASVDARLPRVPSLGLAQLEPGPRRLAAASLAARVAVVARFTPFPAVDDAEFARRAFAFSVLRQMTADAGGIARERAGHDGPEFEAWIRRFVLAAAARHDADGEVRSAYEAARKQDEAARDDRSAMRRAFAAPYVDQVAALLGK
jgi:hypothetical protein